MSGPAFKPEFIFSEHDLPRNPVPGTVYYVEEDLVQIVVRRDGRLVRFAGGGAGDTNNLGYYTSLDELKAAHPTAEAGNYARIVNETEMLFCVWNAALGDWRTSTQGGGILILNDKMPDANGKLTLGANDVGAYSKEQTDELIENTNKGVEETLKEMVPVDSLAGDEQNKAPSVRAVKAAFGKMLKDMEEMIDTLETVEKELDGKLDVEDRGYNKIKIGDVII